MSAQATTARTRTEHTYAPDAVEVASTYFQDLIDHARRIDVPAVARVASYVTDTIRAGRTVFVAGNGGSASAAGHMVCDLLGICLAVGLPEAKVVGLADNIAVVTALANDIGYADVFARQVELLGSEGDLLMLFSVSGDSPNVIQAARTALAKGLRVVAALGKAGSVLEHCHAAVEFGGGDYGLTEDLHLSLNHIVVRLLNGGSPRVHTTSSAVVETADPTP